MKIFDASYLNTLTAKALNNPRKRQHRNVHLTCHLLQMASQTWQYGRLNDIPYERVRKRKPAAQEDVP